MEYEYKWIISDEKMFRKIATSNTVASFVLSKNDIHMQAIYYDTANQLLKQMGGALRLRKENDDTLCCLKLKEQGEGAYKTRKEFEVEADNIYDGLTGLASDVDESNDICNLLKNSTFVELCRTDFLRQAYLLNIELSSGSCRGELAFDYGKISLGTQSMPICEMEFEYKSDDFQAFFDFADLLQKEFCLTPQPLFKFARGMGLKKV